MEHSRSAIVWETVTAVAVIAVLIYLVFGPSN
jgi:hypothetical protein